MESAEFFKVFLTDKASTQLVIPRSFTKLFNGIAPCEVILVEHEGKCWNIKLEKMEDLLAFKSGWQKFAKEKNLEQGDFLVFQYDGKTTFNVKIFAKTGCRKMAAPPSRVKDVPIINLEEDSDEHSYKIQSNGVRKRSLSRLKTNVKSVTEGVCPLERAQPRSKRRKEEKDKINVEKPTLTKSVPLQDPHFQINFDSPWKLKRVELPKKLLNNMNIKLHKNITLRDENGRSWLVSICSTSNHTRHYLGNGWFVFKESKNIQQGFQCDFRFVVDKANVAIELLVHVHSKINNN